MANLPADTFAEMGVVTIAPGSRRSLVLAEAAGECVLSR